jgi:ABC-type Fe3+-siderophore transport system permease subunit
MSNLILQLVSLLSAMCGLITASFLLIVYTSVRRLGGTMERRHLIVISGVALAFFLGAVTLAAVGKTV